ncbi:FecR family protein [Prolixibacteraceae bacterium JC049]|nr:FecR family protein [Prolixibacteraceae bacterium JC049]
MDENKNIEPLKRYTEGKYSYNDYQKVKDWIVSGEKNADWDKAMGEQWNELLTQKRTANALERVYEKMNRQIRIEKQVETRRSWMQLFQKVAAILILPIVACFAVYVGWNENYTYEEQAEVVITCPIGVRTQFQLPDGTSGYLQSGSSLKYPAQFAHDRDVHLSGEAFFDVKKDRGRTFSVLTENLKVNVLGTRFNVSAYSDAEKEEVVLEEGKVEVNTHRGQFLEILSPNEKLTMNQKTNKFQVEEIEIDQYIAWIDGKLVFRNESFSNVITRLERWYNIDIELENDQLLQYTFRATFKDESLDEVLNLLMITAPFTYEIEKREKNQNNEYNKKKVWIKIDDSRLVDFIN